MTSLPLIPAATLILIKDSQDGIKTLLLQRQSKVSFLPNTWVFPGGIIEQQDQQAQNDLWQTAKLAAIRETQEEAGLSIASHQAVPFSRWIAPKEAGKRFDTHFFIATSETTQTALQDSEIQAGQWIKPIDAIRQHQEQQLTIIPPTLVSLEWIKHFDNCQSAMQYFQQQTPMIFEPKVCFHQEQTIMLYHDDVAYRDLDIQRQGKKHRCVLNGHAWQYIFED